MNKTGKKLIAGIATFSLVLSSAVTTVMAESPVTSVLNRTRLWGNNRYETAVQISQAGWKTSDYVVLASGENFADALCAAPLAKKLNAPILLTESNELNTAARDEIKRLNAKHVVIIGLTGAVSGTAENEVKALGADTERIGGQDRYETSTLVAKALDTSSKVVLASGEAYPDALSIAPIAASEEMPILLTRQGQLPQTVANYIEANKAHITKTYVIGETGAVSQAVSDAADKNAVRIGGANRFDTNADVLNYFADELNYKNIYLAVGDGPQGNEFADALAGSALAVKTSSPLVLVYNDLNPNTEKAIQNEIAPKKNVIALGGQAVLPDSIIDKVNSLNVDAAVYSVDGATKTAGDVTKSNVDIDAKNVTLKDANVSGNVYIYGDGAKLSNVKVAGTVYVDPGENGSVDLENVQASQIRVRSGAQNSIHLINVTADKLLVESDNADNSVRVVSSGTTSIGNTVVSSYAIVDSEGGTLGTVTVAVNGAGNKVVQLQGTFTSPVVVSGGATINVAAGANVKSLQVVGSASIAADSTANVQNVEIDTLGNETVALSGKIASVSLNSPAKVQIAANAVINSISVAKGALGAIIDVSKGASVSSVTGDGASSVTITGDGAGNVTTGTTVGGGGYSGGGGGGTVTPTTDDIQNIVNLAVPILNNQSTVTNNLQLSEMQNDRMTITITNTKYTKLADLFAALQGKDDSYLSTKLSKFKTLLDFSDLYVKVAGVKVSTALETYIEANNKYANYFNTDGSLNNANIIGKFRSYKDYNAFVTAADSRITSSNTASWATPIITIDGKTLTSVTKDGTKLYDSSNTILQNWNLLKSSGLTGADTTIASVKGTYEFTIGGTVYTVVIQ